MGRSRSTTLPSLPAPNKARLLRRASQVLVPGKRRLYRLARIEVSLEGWNIKTLYTSTRQLMYTSVMMKRKIPYWRTTYQHLDAREGSGQAAKTLCCSRHDPSYIVQVGSHAKRKQELWPRNKPGTKPWKQRLSHSLTDITCRSSTRLLFH